MTKMEALALINLSSISLVSREDFPRGRSGYIVHICAPNATRAMREDAFKMAVRGLENTEEANALRADIDAYYQAEAASAAASALGAIKSDRKAAASRANGRKGGRPRRSASGAGEGAARREA